MRIVLAVLVLLLAISGGYLLFRPRVQALSLPTLPAHLSKADVGLANWQDYQRPLPTHTLNNPALPQSPQVEQSLALLEDAAGQALVHQGQLTRGFAYLRAAAQADPNNLRYNNDYRLALRNHGRYTDEEAFFSQQAQHVKTDSTAISLALAYVDAMRACPRPPDGLVCQAQDSSHSITVLTGVLKQHPYNVVARYARGLNNLYWPSLMGHLPQAQTDLLYTIALLRPFGSLSSGFPPQAYAALGDVFAKDGQTGKARNVWLNGKRVVSNPSILNSRLAIPQNQLVNEENNQLRGLGVYVETDLAIFWQSGR
jgi:tetratricopeptide (TPR) repeat protein